MNKLIINHPLNHATLGLEINRLQTQRLTYVYPKMKPKPAVCVEFMIGFSL